MDLLLDTCVFIFWDSASGSLTSTAAAALHDATSRLYLSYASIWEMQLKYQKGKLVLRQPLGEIIQEQCTRNGLLLLPIELPDIYGFSQLPFHHTDPFDRLIISQAKLRGLSIITDDREFAQYGVPVVG